MPVILGHGNAMNEIEGNPCTKAWADLAAMFPPPRIILAISAHWYAAGSRHRSSETADDP